MFVNENFYDKIYEKIVFVYSPLYKTLPKSSFQLHWISIRFYELGITGNKLTFLLNMSVKAKGGERGGA